LLLCSEQRYPDAPDGVDSNTMDLVVAEGLRQLGVSHNIDKHT